MMENPVPGVRAPFHQMSSPQTRSKELFYRYFTKEVTELQEQMAQLEAFAPIGGERQDAIDACLAGITRLSDEVADANDFIPAYDQRTYSQAIKALTDKLQETRSKLQTKPRFQFKTFKNPSAISLNDAAELASKQRLHPPSARSAFNSSESSMVTTPAHPVTPPSEVETNGLSSLAEDQDETPKKPSFIRNPSFSQASNINISGHTGAHIILPSSASHATSSGSLTKLSGCVVDASAPTANGTPLAGLIMKNIKNSLIIAGHVAGAAHITGVENSIIVVVSRQVRMHDCKNVDMYLHCASRPIIEDCHNVRFSPIPECYMHKSEEQIESHWDQVDDFKWLKVEPSPNWSPLPEEKRLQGEVWTKDVAGGSGTGVDAILKGVGVKQG